MKQIKDKFLFSLGISSLIIGISYFIAINICGKGTITAGIMFIFLGLYNLFSSFKTATHSQKLFFSDERDEFIISKVGRMTIKIVTAVLINIWLICFALYALLGHIVALTVIITLSCVLMLILATFWFCSCYCEERN